MASNKSLTASFVKNAKNPGRYYDINNTGLHLYVRKSGSKSWVQRVNLRGKSIDIGLGSTSKVTLLEARTKSLENAKLVSEGTDPRKLKPKANVIPNFKTISDEFLTKKKPELSNSKHFAQWETTLSQYVHPSLGNLPVNEITVTDIFNTLSKIWLTKNETASRTRGRIENVLSYAITKGHRDAPNPAIWKGTLENLLPKPSKVQNPVHMPAVPCIDMPRWWDALKRRDGTGAKALMLLTMLAARSGEVRGMLHSELEFFTEEEATEKGYMGLWTIPGTRMKAKREHITPIIKPIFELLQQLPRQGDLVFSGVKGGMLSDGTLSSLMKRIHASDTTGFIDSRSKRPAVPHGIRSTFRDWAAETSQEIEPVELQLAHRIGTSTTKAYNRSERLETRAKVLTEWYNFLNGN